MIQRIPPNSLRHQSVNLKALMRNQTKKENFTGSKDIEFIEI